MLRVELMVEGADELAGAFVPGNNRTSLGVPHAVGKELSFNRFNDSFMVLYSILVLVVVAEEALF